MIEQDSSNRLSSNDSRPVKRSNKDGCRQTNQSGAAMAPVTQAKHPNKDNVGRTNKQASVPSEREGVVSGRPSGDSVPRPGATAAVSRSLGSRGSVGSSQVSGWLDNVQLADSFESICEAMRLAAQRVLQERVLSESTEEQPQRQHPPQRNTRRRVKSSLLATTTTRGLDPKYLERSWKELSDEADDVEQDFVMVPGRREDTGSNSQQSRLHVGQEPPPQKRVGGGDISTCSKVDVVDGLSDAGTTEVELDDDDDDDEDDEDDYDDKGKDANVDNSPRHPDEG